MDRYNFKSVEQKWQKLWEEEKTFSSKVDKTKKKFYCLEMFPYPSGKIHMGHVRNYTIGDVLARYKSLQGYNVLHPMGWDSFGMPAENAAKQNNLDPKNWTEENIKNMKKQLKSIGLSIDWEKEISTCSKEYYKHQQKLFLDLRIRVAGLRKWDYVEGKKSFHNKRLYSLPNEEIILLLIHLLLQGMKTIQELDHHLLAFFFVVYQK